MKNIFLIACLLGWIISFKCPNLQNSKIMKKIEIQIDASEYTLMPRTNTDWWLDVKWSIQNLGEQTYYVLTDGFLSISLGDSVLIDHTTGSGSYKINAQIDPVMKFEKLKSKDSIILQYKYPLPHIPALKFNTIKVVGKFAVNQTKPDSIWTNASNWELIQSWENIVFSSKFLIKN